MENKNTTLGEPEKSNQYKGIGVNMIYKNVLHAARCLSTIAEIEKKIEVLKNVTSEDYKVNFNVEVFGIGDLIFVSEDVEPTVDLAKEAIYLITKKLQEELDALTIDYKNCITIIKESTT